MISAYFEQSLSRANRNLSLAGAFILLCGAVFGLFQYESVRYFIFGPKPANPRSITFDMPLDSAGQFIRIESGQSVEIGTETSGPEGSEGEVRARFHVVYGSGGPLVVRADRFTMEPPFEGRLVPIPDDVRKKIIQPAAAKRVHLGGMRPFMLDATDRGDAGAAYIGLLVVAGSIGLGCFVVSAQRTIDIRKHPSYRELRRFGVPAVVALTINGESQDLMPEPGKVWFTTSWIVVPTLFGVRAFRYKDLVWVHVKSSTFTFNFIPLLWSRCAVFHDRFGIVANVARGFTVGKATQVVSALASRAPWVIYGYTPQYSRGWSTDREGMIRYVDAQRARHEAPGDASLDSNPPARRAPRPNEPPSEWSPLP